MIELSKHNKQIVVLLASSLVGLLFGVLSSVINTRALSPDFYGDVRYVQNIIAFVSSLLLMGYFVSGSRLLATSKDEEDCRKLRGVMCIILAITIGIVMLVMLALFLFCQIKSDSNMAILYLSAIPVCGNVLMLNYVNTVSQGDNHIGRIALARLLPTAIYCLIAFYIYKVYSATPVLMLLLFNGIAVVTLTCIILSTRPSFSKLSDVFHRLNEENKAYGFDVYVGSLVDVSTGYISGITLGWFCETNAQVGFYTLALTLATPLALLPSIIGTTYFKKFAAQNAIDRDVMRNSIFLTAGCLLVFIAMIKIVVGFLYDDSYSVVSQYASILAVGTSLHGFADMLNRFLGAHGQGKMLRNTAFLCGGITVIGSVLFVYLWGIYGAILTRVLSSVVCLIAMVYYYQTFKKNSAI